MRLVCKAGIHRSAAEQVPLLAGIAGLLEQLALDGRQRLFAVVDHAGGEFGADLPHGMAILIDQNDIELGRQRDHIDPVGVLEDMCRVRRSRPPGSSMVIAAQAKPRIGEGVSRREHLPALAAIGPLPAMTAGPR